MRTIFTTYLRNSIFLLLLSITGSIPLYSQDSTNSKPLLSISGTASLSADFYDFTSTPSGAQQGRRPPSLYRFLFSPTLTIGSMISLPFNIMFTTPETNTTTGTISNPSIAQYFQNPANAFGISSFSPAIGWAQFHIGSHSPNFSALTAGDQQIFGGGFDLKPGSFRFAASAGVAQRAIESDAAHNIRGAYRRDMYMGRIGFGKEDSTIFGLNIVYTKDAVQSLQNTIITINPLHKLDTDTNILVPADTVRLRAEEGYVASADMKLNISDGISCNAEAALSSFTRDLSAPEKNIDGNPFSSFQTTRTSTRADVAATAALNIRQPFWGIKVSGTYMGAGFVPVGYSFMQADRLEFSVAPSIKLLNNKFSINGSVGERINNLSETKGETTTQLILSGALNADITEEFTLSANYSNFGIRNNQTIDSFKVETVSQSFSIDPTLTLQQTSINHTISMGFSLDQFKDYNIVSGAESSNDMQTLMASYSASLVNIPLRVSFFGSYMENGLSTGILIIRTIGTNISYSFFDRRVVPTFSFSASGNTVGANPTDEQVFYKLALRWEVTKMISATASAGNNSFTYGNPTSRGTAFRENIVQLSLSTRF